jgi:single-stranded-DNA-specific exonuclease
MEIKWKFLSENNASSIEEIISILLSNRKVSEDPNSFLDPISPNSIPLSDMGINEDSVIAGWNLIRKHMQMGNNIAIYGDYDVDGVCSTAILWETIYREYRNVFPHIPHRESEGYGLSITGIDICISKGAKLIVALDNGIVAHKQIDYAKSRGLDVIVIDHHQEKDTLPAAEVLIHSKRTCAAALTWAFVRGNERNLSQHLELVAIAVISDMIPLTGINRSFAKWGLLTLNESTRPGLKAMIEEAGLTGKLGPYEVGFVIGPRINATGRLEHALSSLRLLCTQSLLQARDLALFIGEINKTRQEMTRDLTNHAFSSLESEYSANLPNLLIVDHETYHPGIIGLIAAKLVEKYNRPAIAISRGEEIAKASARSVGGFDITSHIRRASDLLLEVGGHEMAAGFSVKNTNITKLKSRLLADLGQYISPDMLNRVIKVDCIILPNQISHELYNHLQTLEPFGLGNPEPSFMSREMIVEDIRQVGKENKHLKLKLSGINAIGFGLGALYPVLKIGEPVSCVYSISQDNFNGRSGLQIKIKDIKIHEPS